MNKESKKELINRFVGWFAADPLLMDDLLASAEEFLDHEELLEGEYPDTISITWSVEDFEGRAVDMEESEDDLFPIYDRTKFAYALSIMKDDHDCNNGITWETVDFYLDEYCKLQ